MTAAPNAARMTASALARDRELLAREARDIADRATRFAEDVERGINVGAHRDLAAAAQDWYARAVRYDAVQETAGLYNTELDTQESP